MTCSSRTLRPASRCPSYTQKWSTGYPPARDSHTKNKTTDVSHSTPLQFHPSPVKSSHAYFPCSLIIVHSFSHSCNQSNIQPFSEFWCSHCEQSNGTRTRLLTTQATVAVHISTSPSHTGPFISHVLHALLLKYSVFSCIYSSSFSLATARSYCQTTKLAQN